MTWTPSAAALAAITVCVVAAGAGAGVLLQPTKDPVVPAAMGPGVSIALVAPHEPMPEPGGVMEVGDLSDVYMHRSDILPASVIARSRNGSQGDPPARAEPRRVERPSEAAPKPAPAPVMSERPERPRRWPTSLDQPRPDYAAERRERMARRDDQRRLDEERRFEEMRLAERFADRRDYSAPPPVRAREPLPIRDRGLRERQWYRDDGARVPGPETSD